MYNILWVWHLHWKRIEERKERIKENKEELLKVLEEEFNEQHDINIQSAKKTWDYEKFSEREKYAADKYMRRLHSLNNS